jgi:hypothetical protein
MAVTDAEYRRWLTDDNRRRAVLLEAEYHDGASAGTAYLANVAYISGQAQTPAAQPYDDLLIEVPEIRSRIDGELAIGRFELHNDGSLDAWLERAWEGWPMRAYIGDPAWARSDFRLVLSGTCGGIEAPRPERLALTWRDRRRELEVPAQTTRTAAGDLVPLALGQVFNAEPVLTDSANLDYRFHEDGAASVDAVRDNGVGVAYTDNGDGSQTLSNNPAGRITLDATGATDATPSGLITWLAQRAGLGAGEIGDLSHLPTWPMGLYVASERTIAELLTEVCRSLGAVWRFDRLGVLQVYRLDLPATSEITLDADDVARRGLRVVRTEAPRSEIVLGYAPNWAVQDPGSQAASVPVADQRRYATAYETVTAANAIATQWPAAQAAERVDTLLVNQADAQAEADRRAALRADKRRVYSVAGFTAPFAVGIGDTLTLDHPRYGWDGGVDGVVVGLREHLTRAKATLEVWR